MKNFRSPFFLSAIFILCMGLFIQSFPIKVASAAGGSGTTDNSGGFIVQADKVEGSMNPVAMAAGDVVMGEGKIYGLTITKVLSKSKPALIIKIKSQGPIPVKNLNGKLMGLPQFSSPCLPSQVGWLCLNNVKMKLSEQTVGAISLPNATIETCFEGQCSAGDQTIEGKSLDEQNNGGDTSIPEITKQLDQLTDIIDETKELQDVIDQGKDTLEDIIKKAEDAVGLPDQLGPLTQQIKDQYKQLKESLDKLLPLLGQGDQLLSQILGGIHQLDATKLTNDLTDRLQEMKDKTAVLKETISALKSKQQVYAASLKDFQKDFNDLKASITTNKNQYSGGEIQSILQNLDPGNSNQGATPSTQGGASTTTTTTTTGGTGGTTSNGGNSGGTASTTTADLQKQLTEAIDNGKKLTDSIQGLLDKADPKMDDMKQLSGSLVSVNLLLVKVLDTAKADQFQADLDDVKGYVDSMAGPVQQLKDTISTAEALQTQLGENSSDIEQFKAVLDQVGSLESRLQNLSKKDLNALPLLSRILSFIDQIDDMIKEMDAWDI